MKALPLILALACIPAAAQTIRSDCAISYRSDGAAQLAESTRVGVPYVSSLDGRNYSWLQAVAVTLPSTPIKSATLVVPTIGSGAQGEYLTTTATVYATLSLTHDGASTCAGYGPGFIGLAKPKKDNSMVRTAATIKQPWIAPTITLPLNAATVAALNERLGESVTLGVQMLVERMEVPVPGDDPKKVNRLGVVVDFSRARCSGGTWSSVCPTLVVK